MQQPLSGMSHTHRIFFGFVLPPSYESTQSFTDKKCSHYVERGHLTRYCPLASNCLRNPTIAESSNTTLEDELTMQSLNILRRADVVFAWKLVTLEETYPEDNVP
jgi:hypothetical protein